MPANHLASRLVSQPTTIAVLAVLPTSRDLALLDARLERAVGHVELLGRPGRRNVEVKDIHRQADGRARIRDVHDARYVALDRGAGEQKVDLVVAVAKPPQILDDAF